VNVSITVFNLTSNTNVKDGYLYVSVTEDNDLKGNEVNMPSLPSQVYLSNEVDEQAVAWLNPMQLIN
jgi:hypothetical protein